MYHMLKTQYANTHGGIVNTIPFSFYIYRYQPSYYIRPDYLNKPLNYLRKSKKLKINLGGDRLFERSLYFMKGEMLYEN